MRPITYILKKNVNCYDLNFIFILAGFTFLTSLYANPVASIAYNGIGACIALWGLLGFKGQPKFKLSGDYPKAYLFIVSLFWVRCLYELIFGEYQGIVLPGKTQGLLFFFGKVLLPLLAFLKGWRQLHIKTCMLGVFALLSFSIILGLGTLATQQHELGEDARFSLNASQGSLAFADNGALLTLVSLCLLFFTKKYFTRQYKLWSIIFIVGALIGISGGMKAGSRGPIMSLIAAIFYLLYISRPKIKLLAVAGIIAALIFSTATTGFIKEFAPALYSRSMNTIERQDTSGRDILFAHAIEEANTHPIIGTNPLIVGSGIWSYHNIYLNYLMGCGYLAFAMYIAFILLLLRRILLINIRTSNPLFILIFSLFFYQCMRGMTGGNMLVSIAYNFAMISSATIVSSILHTKSLHNHETATLFRDSDC